MPVRLNKVIAELNVALDRIDRFLAKKGKPLTDVSPNAKISDEQYNLLNEEFGKDKSINNTTKENIQKLKDKQRQDKADRKAKQREEEQNRQGIFRTDTGRQKYTPLGNINDFNKAKEETKREVEEQVVNTPKKEEEKVDTTPIVEDKAPETAPEKTAVVEKKTENVNEPEEKPVIVEEKEEIRKEEIVDNEEEKSEEEDFSSDSEKTDGKKNDGIYRVTPTAAPISFKQVGFIDLNTINGKTRPDRKSKAEKKKEREEKGRQMHQGKQAG